MSNKKKDKVQLHECVYCYQRFSCAGYIDGHPKFCKCEQTIGDGRLYYYCSDWCVSECNDLTNSESEMHSPLFYWPS